ncbi:hypothetical protein [Pendulispora albinea]|uniref:Lipoprotein n=1 Tax=Pendulispora albinea TaxID=2741071 RepID=A0ABZ2M2Q2_9BACT
MSAFRGPCVFLVAACAIAVVGGAACDRKPEVSFTLRAPAGIRDQTAWYEIGVFANAACPTDEQLAAGIPIAGATARAAFRRDSPTRPAIGDLARGSYAFAAVAKGENCSVLAAGCTSVDVGDSHDVTIALNVKNPPSPGCGEGTVCTNAQCAPSNDNGQPSVGAGCSLELLGAGPLGNPLGLSGTIVSQPAIVPTERGFLIAYREYDAIQGLSRLTFIPLDPGGGMGRITTKDLPGRCATSEEADAVGLAYAPGQGGQAGQGLAVVARATCNEKSGFDLFNLDSSGTVTKSAEDTSASFNGAKLALSPAHAVAVSERANGFYVAALKNGQAIVTAAADARFTAAPIPFGGSAPHGEAWVATSDKLSAWLVASSSGAPSGDAGANPPPDGGKLPILRLQMAAAGTNPSSLPAPVEMLGAWGSLAAQGTRVVVASDGSAVGQSLLFRVFELGTPAPKVEESFNTEAAGKVLFADVAYQKAHAFFAVEQPDAITIVAYDKMTTDQPTFLREAQLARNPRVPSLKQVRDGRLAITATDTRVAVVWATARTLTDHDPTGGYAVLACR